MQMQPAHEAFASLTAEEADEQITQRWHEVERLQAEIRLLEVVRAATPELRQQWARTGMIDQRRAVCGRCGGSGEHEGEECGDCLGDGYLTHVDAWHRDALEDLMDKLREGRDKA